MFVYKYLLRSIRTASLYYQLHFDYLYYQLRFTCPSYYYTISLLRTISNTTMSGIDHYKPAPGIATKVYVRFRPILPNEGGNDSPDPLQRPLALKPGSHGMTIRRKCWSPSDADKDMPDKIDTESSFFKIFRDAESNREIYNQVFQPMMSSVMAGKTCNVFLYGCTGSGKTYTLLGDGPCLDKNQGKDGIGIFWAAAEKLFGTCFNINKENQKKQKDQKTDIPVLQVVVRVYTIVGEISVDRLHPKSPVSCPHNDNGTHPEQFLPATTRLYGGYSRFAEEVVRELEKTLLIKAPYSDPRYQHSIFELEVTTTELLEDHKKVREIEEELSATQEFTRELQDRMSGAPTNYTLLAALAEQEKKEASLKDNIEKSRTAFRSKVSKFKASSSNLECIEGRIMFVDLAGAECNQPNEANPPPQTAEETAEGLLLRRLTVVALARLNDALSMRGSEKQSEILRKSIFTNLLREQIEASNEGKSTMICTLRSQERDYYDAHMTLGPLQPLGSLAKPDKS